MYKPKRHTRIYISFEQLKEQWEKDHIKHKFFTKGMMPFDEKENKAGFVISMLHARGKLHYIFDECPGEF